MFSTLKKQMQAQFASFTSEKQPLFSVTVDREKIWELYINGFDESIKQEHTCNCCKSFLRQYGGVVTIKNGKMISLWDIEVEEEYKKSIEAVRNYIHSLPITNVFVNAFEGLGTDKNTQLVEGKTPIIWNHFYYKLDRSYVRHKDTIDTYLGQCRDNKSVLKRSLDELTMESVDTVLELIAQGSLYRGTEFKAILDAFKALKVKYETLTPEDKDNFTWIESVKSGAGVSRIRNMAIGTLLIDLSEGKDLDVAVSAFERVVAPTNYKRPTALVTPKMVEEAKKKIEELGFSESLERRMATAEDIVIDNLIYADRSSEVTDVFDEITKDTKVNPRTLSKVEEISIDDFLNNVVPKSKSIEVLVENGHLNNMVTLLTSENKEAPSMFKWPNAFSWSYTGGITDSMKERVKEAGGKVDGVLRFSIQWNEDGKSIIDLDAHCIEPDGNHIFFRDKRNYTTLGNLDVDMINPRKIGVENITWPSINKMQEGTYRFFVNNFSEHKRFNGVRCEIEFNGEVFEFGTDRPFTDNFHVAEVVYSVKNGFTIKPTAEVGKSSVASREKWGINSNQFHKVKSIMLSPNCWNGKAIGNKHYIFSLEGCNPDETPRPFFNEFLKEELNKDRKVLEILGSKVKVGKVTNPISGIGFSETQRNHMFVKVQGTFKRTLKVNF